MDYSRFNYLVQPEDGVPVDLLIPRVGVYDRFAIRWGYAPVDADSPEAERQVLVSCNSDSAKNRGGRSAAVARHDDEE